ncbi:histone-lysine N-methyltransferase SETMAR [Trichonephila clavipes]|nr:histone-lysine N-methyltransferase SETMAR [Trichonephila clavipes]
MPYHTARWVGKFQPGRVSTSDEQRSGRPVSVRTYLARAVIEKLMEEDIRWTLMELGRKVASRNAPSTGYCACEPELKRQSAEFQHAGLPRRQKVLQNPSPVKLLVIVAYDVRRGVRYKRPDLVDCAIILHDNARPHKTEYVRQLFRRWGWEELEHPLYSPDSPLDLNLFLKIKEPIRGKRFATGEDIANAERRQGTLFTHCAANAEDDGIQRLQHRWQHVVIVAGDYIEGL